MELCDRTPESGDSGSNPGNSVSQLQEYVQGCTQFWPHTKILTWSFEQRLGAEASLQFRALVSFVFRDVPHHFSGDWLTSKKKAQRDTAERVRHYLERHFEAKGGRATSHARLHPDGASGDLQRELRALCQPPGQIVAGAAHWNPKVGVDCTSTSMRWDMTESEEAVAGREGGPRRRFRATLTMPVQKVPHHLSGCWCESAEDAQRDTAERVLWLLGASTGAFSADERLALHRAALPPPQLSAAGGGAAGGPAAAVEPQSATEDKTLLMQVQNALQKAFAKDLLPGQRVWQWSYEPDSRDPQLFLARVEVPPWGLTFEGDWCRGKKLAQRSACLAVKRHLERWPLPSSDLRPPV